MKNLILLAVLLWTVHIREIADRWDWTAYKIEDNKVAAILHSGEDFSSEFMAKVNWLKYARFFSLTDSQFSYLKP